MRVAAIDIGTNTVLLLIAEQDDTGRIVPVVERAEITRLGQGVDRARALAPDAIERTLACVGDYAAEIRHAGVDAVDAVGTSAMRDASGGDLFVKRAQELLGIAPRVVSGEEEARLTFAGGTIGLGLSGDVTLFDVGGGSTEIVSGTVIGHSSTITTRVSLDIGSVRLTERLVRSDPPTNTELDSVRSAVDEELARVHAPDTPSTFVGVAGTVTTLAAVAAAIDPYDGARVHGSRLTLETVDEIAARLATLDLTRRRGLPGMEPKRADVIVAGACIVRAILGWARAPSLVVSDRGVRWGLALDLLSQKPSA